MIKKLKDPPTDFRDTSPGKGPIDQKNKKNFKIFRAQFRNVRMLKKTSAFQSNTEEVKIIIEHDIDCMVCIELREYVNGIKLNKEGVRFHTKLVREKMRCLERFDVHTSEI